MQGLTGGGVGLAGEGMVCGGHWDGTDVGEAVIKSVPAVVRQRKSANGGVLIQERMGLSEGMV